MMVKKAANSILRNQIQLLKELRELEKQRLPHQLELHKGLESIAVAEEEIKEKVKKDIRFKKTYARNN